MDPAFRELLRTQPADRVVEAIIRFRRPRVGIPGVRIVASFGRIATCRLRLGEAYRIWSDPDVVSLKAPRSFWPDPEAAPGQGWSGEGWSGEGWSGQSWQRRRPEGLSETGAGVAVGIIDFGFDVAHPNLRANDGTTRVLALWDQRTPATSERPPPEPYGYGVVHTREEIDAALRSPTPFRELGYYPADADRADIGAHATHVTDIAAGSGRVGPMGMAPGADLILVHLADRYTGGLATLGDSSHLLEAAHFVVRTAGTRPWVINLSMGRHGGPHKGCTLLELALDDLLRAGPGRFVAQSAGNYHDTRTHASGLVTEGETTAVRFVTDPDDVTPNELEVWYSGDDEFVVHLDPPGSVGPPVALGDCADVVVDGQVVGRIYHRAFDPNCGDSHIDAFLSAAAPAGIWRVRLTGLRVADGVFHAWLERDEACGACQARFVAEDASSDCTLGTLANGRLPLVVGAYDARSLEWPPTPSSSAGPTRDGRDKPDVGAPGKNILAARSAPRGYEQSPGLLVAKTGTSMSTPHVTGAVALCLQRNPRLDAAQIRRLVLSTADPPGPGVEPHRLGHGYLNVAALVAAVPPLPSDLEATAMDLTAMDLTAMDLTGTRDLAAVDAAAHDGVHARFAAIAADPALAYRELLYRPGGGLAAWLGRAVTVVGRPGQRLRRHLQPGDVVLSVVLGDRDGPGECAVLDERRLIRSRLNRPGQPSGWYGVTGSRTGGQSIRVLDPAGVVPPGQLVLRLATTTPDDDRDGGLDEDSPADLPRWTGAPEQREFRARVLAEHLARTRKAKGAPQRDLREDELADIPGACTTGRDRTTCVRTLPATAESAGQLLAAANADLTAAQRAGDADALRTVRLTAGSGYRGSEHQRRLWLDYFATKYYGRSGEARAKIPDGPHSDAAVDYLLRPKRDGGYGIPGRIAAPGYSNHQAGIAVDFQQVRTRGHQIPNDSDDPARCLWRHSWFHGWLRVNAPRFGFRPIPTEEWHWEYRPAARPASAPADYRGGRLWTFASRVMPLPVAVFCPKAALGRRDVDVLLFAHGLLDRCRRPKQVPEGIITDPPFAFGRILDASARPVVLVVPLLDWANPCGEVVFGSARRRWHPLGLPSVLNTLVAEALAEVGRVQGSGPPAVHQLVVAGHSRAYDVLEPLAAHRSDAEMGRGALARLAQVWAFDTTYAADVAAWTDWLTKNPALAVHVYYRPGPHTGTVGDLFHAQRGDRLRVTQASEEHCAVPATRLAELLPPAQATGAREEIEPAEADGSRAAVDPDLSAMFGLAEAELLFADELPTDDLTEALPDDADEVPEAVVDDPSGGQ